MKKFTILFSVLAVCLAVLFASCNPTTGLEELEPSDVTEKWVKGVWKGTIVYEIDGGKTSKDVEFDYSGSVLVVTGVATFKSYAKTGNFYADYGRTKVVYYDKQTDKNGKTKKITTTLRKQ